MKKIRFLKDILLKLFIYKRNKRFLVLLFFISVSTLVWILNALSKTYITDIRYPIQFQYDYEDKIILNDLPEYLDIKVSGIGYSLLAYQFLSSLNPVVIEMKDIPLRKKNQKETITYFLLTTSLNEEFSSILNIDDKLISIKPDTLFFKLSKISKKRVPVRSELDLIFDQQSNLKQDLKIDPDSIDLFGPDFLLDSIKSWSTENKQINQITDSKEITVPLKVSDAIKTSTDKVKISISVEKYTESTTTIPLVIKNLPDSIVLKLLPGNVKIQYMVGLSRYDKYTAVDFAAEVDYNDIALHASKKLQITITQQPKFVNAVIPKPSLVEYILEKK